MRTNRGGVSRGLLARGVLILAAGGLALAGCASRPPRTTEVVVVRKEAPTAKAKGYGPPPHAPAHGYRAKQRNGVDLVYDAHLRVYVVSGRARHYYCDGRYYRRVRRTWQVSVSLDGPWSVTATAKLPGRLASAS